MNNFGIDAISCYVPNYYLDIKTLSEADNSLGQEKISICPPDEDIVTMATNAAWRITRQLTTEELNSIEAVLFATESGIDFSKSAASYVHRLLNLSKRCRVIELKQACYGATAGLQLGLALIKQNPQKKVLLLASDVARYALQSTAESSQGAGAVAMLLTANPHILAIQLESGFYSEEVMDFWRPNYCTEAFVDGKYSCEVYLRALEACWRDYATLSGRKFLDHTAFCYHMPVPKLAEMAHRRLAKINGIKLNSEETTHQMALALQYGRIIGNCYTASLYLGIASLLENASESLAGKRLGLYSYGSGCSGEYFSGLIAQNYNSHLFKAEHQAMLANRDALTCEQYHEFYNFKLPQDGSNYSTPEYSKHAKFRLAGISEHKRIYT